MHISCLPLIWLKTNNLETMILREWQLVWVAVLVAAEVGGEAEKVMEKGIMEAVAVVGAAA
ncbi:MAG TPA: hypothetical protein VEH06_11040 [Candidatus Bathyarchaeia archaeon]|nr:hypothetical protein [Candidatus Bathyarchaeia archaeon]